MFGVVPRGRVFGVPGDGGLPAVVHRVRVRARLADQLVEQLHGGRVDRRRVAVGGGRPRRWRTRSGWRSPSGVAVAAGTWSPSPWRVAVALAVALGLASAAETSEVDAFVLALAVALADGRVAAAGRGAAGGGRSAWRRGRRRLGAWSAAGVRLHQQHRPEGELGGRADQLDDVRRGLAGHRHGDLVCCPAAGPGRRSCRCRSPGCSSTADGRLHRAARRRLRRSGWPP